MHSEECKRKISESLKGHKVSEETKKKIGHTNSIILKGRKLSKKHKKNISFGMLGEKNHFFGKHHTKESLKKISEASKNRIISEETRKRLSECRLGSKHPNWLGGKSFEPYSSKFNKKLKEQIRKRDGYRCQECFRHQNELDYKLHIHHIDYNKKNSSPNNLVTLCRNCHTKTNFNRNNWTEYYMKQLKQSGVI